MKAKWIPLIFLALGLVIVIRPLKPVKFRGEFDVEAFASLPVLASGRVQPMDSVARNSLLVLRGKQTMFTENAPAELSGFGKWKERRAFLRERKREAVEWLMDAVLAPERAETYPVIRIDHDQLTSLVDPDSERKYYSFKELKPHLRAIEDQAALAGQTPRGSRNALQQAVLKLYQSLLLYRNLTMTLQTGEAEGPVVAQIGQFAENAKKIRAASKKGEMPEGAVASAFSSTFYAWWRAAFLAGFHTLPSPTNPEDRLADWMTLPEALVGEKPGPVQWGSLDQQGREAMEGRRMRQIIDRKDPLDPLVFQYAALIDAYRGGDAAGFNKTAADLKSSLHGRMGGRQGRIAFEEFFNRYQPFYVCMQLYVLVFMLVAVSWLRWEKPLTKAAFGLLVLGFVVHTVGLAARIYIQGRPPVTNLYSSAIFVGWGATLMCVLLEKRFKNGIASVAASIIGFVTLIIAHHYARSGDTMEMMRAVLDSNFWLATHVVTVTFGYSVTFLAGLLAAFYILRGVFTGSLDAAAGKALEGMVYGIVCFALLFSFIGTFTGGIWGDQSWGRFWGWDPKENGALMIVIWNALVLHARWGKVAGPRGIMVLAVVGSIITSWSWFGTNFLGVGLHSYGFTDAGFHYLMMFVASQLAIVALGCLPMRMWRSGGARRGGASGN